MVSARTKPAWAGDDWLSRCVNSLIQFKPVYGLMKQQARQVLIKTAEQNGIPWRQTYDALDTSDVKALLPTVQNPDVSYPSYYQVPFHAYDAGNLCWEAAFEAEPATHSMALRVWPKQELTWEEAQHRLRSSFHEVLARRINTPVQDILDVGCSVGLSTLALHQFYQAQADSPGSPQTGHSVRTVGLDLSPYMLTVAKFRDVDHAIADWVHAKAEQTGFVDQSFDLATLQFVIHELPRSATSAIFAEMWRVLRPGGCIALVDNNPKSAVIQNLPPVLFTLMKSTEPWSDDYYTFDVEEALRKAGFEQVETVETDPRHRAITGFKPA